MKIKLILLAVLLGIHSLVAEVAPPNIVFILADDLGWADLHCFGSQYYETPNLDRLAGQGMKFTSAHACQNCAPSRAELMSGQYEPRTGVYTVGSIDRFDWQSRPLRPVDNVTELPRQKITIAQVLKQNGYATGMIGKWHLGEEPGFTPLDRGFDEFFGFLGGAHDYFNGNKGIMRGNKPVKEKEYLTDAFGREAVAFIRKHKDQPFFLYLPFNAVHLPIEAKPDWLAHFARKPGAGGQTNAAYAAMLASLDENIGRVLATLDELKLADNTLVIFGSDNGGVGGYAREGIKTTDITDNWPLRAGKGTLHEGGIRVPYIFRWPGKIAPGSVCDWPVDNVDIYPTLLEVAGAAPPANYPLDGTSYLDLLTDAGQGSHAPRLLFQHFPGYLGAAKNTWRTTPVGVIQDGDWKLLEFFEDERLELFNLKDDLSEQHNLATTNPEKAQELLAKLKAWRASLHASMPTPNPSIQAPGHKRNNGKKASEEKE